MSDDESDLFRELDEFSKELREGQEYYGYPYNLNNPRYNLNLISSETLDELIQQILDILTTAYEYRTQGWELTEPVRFGRIHLHYDRDGEPQWRERNDG